MKFTKMQGLGNDYVYVNCFKEKIDNPPEVAKIVSDRHFGIGSDGLIMINPSKVADFEMEMYNADGSRGEMCGNGIRCVAKYVYDYGLTDKTHISVETLGGIKYLDLTVKDGKVALVRVDMGEPKLDPEKIPIIMKGYSDETDRVLNAQIKVDGKEYHMTGVSMGNPHDVVYIDDVQGLDIEKIGPKFENHERFPQRINTEFARVIDRKTVEMRVWERGSGETLACGTGACAVAVASILNGYTEREVEIRLLGGNLQIEWNEEDNKWDFTHNPFSMPNGGMDALLNMNPGDIVACQYDFVCNGLEMASGGERNYSPTILKKAFEIAGYDESVVESKFPSLYQAFQFGAPPHAGMAPGLDRILMLLKDEENIREMVAFPMAANGADALMGCPNEVFEKQLRETHIKVRD